MAYVATKREEKPLTSKSFQWRCSVFKKILLAGFGKGRIHLFPMARSLPNSYKAAKKDDKLFQRPFFCIKFYPVIIEKCYAIQSAPNLLLVCQGNSICKQPTEWMASEGSCGQGLSRVGICVFQARLRHHLSKSFVAHLYDLNLKIYE